MGYCLIHGIGNARSLENRVRQYVPTPIFYIKAERGDSEARALNMNLRNLSREEKGAILRSFAYIAYADGTMNYSEDMYISMCFAMMDEDPSFASYVNTITQSQMTRTIRNMSNDDKQALVKMWITLASRHGGGEFHGWRCINDFDKEGRVILQLCSECRIPVDASEEYSI